MLNMKILKINIALICVIALAFCVFAFNASAETLQKELIYLDSKANICIKVSYVDNGSGKEPEISFVSPSGTKYSEALGNLTADHSPENNVIFYYIDDASAGQWDIVYDSSFSGKLTVDILKYGREIWIDSFNIKEITSSYAKVEFFVDFPISVNYSYKISVVTLNENGMVDGSRELYSGSAYSNQTVSKNVYWNNLSSYDKYYLLLEVTANDYGYIVSDNILSSIFAYENPDAYDPPEGFDVMLNCDTGEMTVDWSNVMGGRYASRYNIVVTADGTDVFLDTYDRSITRTEFVIDPTATEIKVSMSYERNGRYSNIASLTFYPSADGVDILTEEQTASSQAEISYSVSADSEATVYVNEGLGEKIFLTGNGTFSVTIEPGYNIVKVIQSVNEHIYLLTEKRIYSDRTAPMLDFFEDLTSITTAEPSFIVVGQTEAGSNFTVNGTGYTVEPDGTFRVDLSLNSGENLFEIVSSDAVGNRSVRQIRIVRSTTPGGADASKDEGEEGKSIVKWIPMIASFVLAAIVAVVFIVLGKKKKINFVTVSLMVLIICAVVVAVSAVLLILQNSEVKRLDGVVNGEEFFELVKESPQKAYEQMELLEEAEEALERMKTVTFILTGVAGAALIVFAISLVLLKVKKNKAQKEGKKGPQEEAKEETKEEIIEEKIESTDRSEPSESDPEN